MDKNIVFATNGAERIRVLSDGRVGIGTTNPSSLLSVYNSSGSASADFQSGSNSKYWITSQSSSNVFSIGGNGGTAPSSGAINILSDGKVGIGTTAPQEILHIANSSQDWTNVCVGIGNTSSDMGRHANVYAPDTYIPDGDATGKFNNGLPMYFQSGSLYHRTTGGHNAGGSIVIRAREVRSRANTGSNTTGYEIGGDIFIDSGAIVRRTDGGVGPYIRPGCIYFRTGNDHKVNSAAEVDSQAVGWTTRMFIHGDNGSVGIGTDVPVGNLHISDNAATTSIYVGKSITSNGEYKNSYFIRPNAYIDNANSLPSTINHGGDVWLHSAHLHHNSWGAWNTGGAVRLVAGSVYSRGNTGNTTSGHEIGGDILIDSGAVVKRTDGGAGPYARGGNIILRTGNVYNVSSEAAVNSYPIDYTTRMFIHGGTGHVGIGTDNPSHKLDVRGNIYTPNTVFADGGFSGSALTSTYLYIYGGGATPPVNNAAGTRWSIGYLGPMNSSIAGGLDIYAKQEVTGGDWTTTKVYMQYRVDSSGFGFLRFGEDDLYWSGSFSAASKNFDIPHPLHPEDDKKRLVHGCVEGPRNDLLYRGSVQLVNGRASVNIDRDSSRHRMSDGTFEALCREPVVYLQNNDSFDRVIGKISGATLTIICENSSSFDVIDWMVVADRKDKTIVESNMTDTEGYLITEYTK